MVAIFVIIVFVIALSSIVNQTREMKSDITNNRAQKLQSLVSYNYDGTLYVFERDPKISKVLKVVKDRTVVTAYNPQKVHIGGVVSGGVVSGGTYTTGGNYYVSHSEDSGKYKLVYGGDEQIVIRIQLTDYLYEKAKKTVIANWLDNDKKQIKVVEEAGLSDMDRMWKMANLQAGNFGLTDAEKSGYPSRKKCQDILNWLCSEY